MEFAVSGKTIERKGSNSGVKLPLIVNKQSGGQPETSPRVNIRSAERRPSAGRVNRTPSTSSVTGEKKTHGRDDNSQQITQITKSSGKNPVKMQRAKIWSPEIENLFRYQAAGFRDHTEYISVYPVPECWESTGFVKTLQAKQTGYYMYFRQERECEDRYLNKIKIYSYGG